MAAYFKDRRDAGRQLALRLEDARARQPVILGLARGGVPVAAAVAAALDAPLDVLIVRKLGVPGWEEFAFGALAEDGVRVVDDSLVRRLGLRDEEVTAVVAAASTELTRRVARYRGGRELMDLTDREVIIVDDGLATGATARAAVAVARARGARRVIVAVPVASPDAARDLATVADEVVAVHTPASFRAVGEWYETFPATSDEEVVTTMAEAHR